MAASRAGPTLPSAASCGYTHAPERLRLRNSCHGCASSKLKCSQEKPTCSRCAKRGLTCEYLAAKPGGRKPNRPSVGSQIRPDQPGDAHACLQVQAESAALPSSNTSRPPGMRNSTSSNVIQDLFGPSDEISSCASTTTTKFDFNELFSTPMSDGADVDMLGAADIFSTGVTSTTNGSDGTFDVFPPFGDAIPELFTVSIPGSLQESPVHFGMELAQGYQGFGTGKSPHSCLNRALRSMEHISSLPYQKEASTSTAVRNMVTQNKAAIEAVSTTLTCTCSQDGYLLVVISFLIFKVLDLYAAAARQAPGMQDFQGPSSPSSAGSEYTLSSTATVGNYCLDGADSARMATQLVLNELHLVRRVVKQLSSALQKQAATMEGGSEAGPGLDMPNERTLPFSPATYEHLAVDLVKRCKALSLDIMNQLRKL